MTEDEARHDLHIRGVWQLAPGLWADKNIPDMISVVPEHDTALGVRDGLIRSGMLPNVREPEHVE